MLVGGHLTHLCSVSSVQGVTCLCAAQCAGGSPVLDVFPNPLPLSYLRWGGEMLRRCGNISGQGLLADHLAMLSKYLLQIGVQVFKN